MSRRKKTVVNVADIPQGREPDPLRAFVEKIAGAWIIGDDEPIQGSDAVEWLVEVVKEARKLVKP